MSVQKQSALAIILCLLALTAYAGDHEFIQTKITSSFSGFLGIFLSLVLTVFLFFKRERFFSRRELKTYQLILRVIAIGILGPIILGAIIPSNISYLYTKAFGRTYEAPIAYTSKSSLGRKTCIASKYFKDTSGWVFKELPLSKLPEAFCINDEFHKTIPEQGTFILSGKETVLGRTIERVSFHTDPESQSGAHESQHMQNDWAAYLNFQ